MPLLSTTFQRLLALSPPLPLKSTGSFRPETDPPCARPDEKVAIGSRQLSRTDEQLVPRVVEYEDAKTP
jgi:hypothetical protein